MVKKEKPVKSETWLQSLAKRIKGVFKK